ncbi:preprotein translocase subunit YajC [Agrococcus casei]|uniref:Preprotein translocase subunit YajC (TC 3.A.5.1.1) n=1 Tax=Agrococcus casei LMG 22410 TaxID=1255656 RepID=A0A1R4FPL4_9MICO|nr:preprotein translocase subunit YajC [Agrococcus casei]SJM57904.1 Preprotein translocase subunit YajC (TC 3.A.5.1.1) [Agrococcus casei LMG 22410]
MHLLTETTNQQGGGFTFDPLTIIMLLLLVVLIIFMVRSSRKRKAQAAELQTKMVPGKRIMTSSGIFGTLLWIDDEKLQAGIEVSPGVELVVHRQILAQVVEEDTDSSIDPETDSSAESSRED